DGLDLAVLEQLLAEALAMGHGGLERQPKTACRIVDGALQLVGGDGLGGDASQLLDDDLQGLLLLGAGDARRDRERADVLVPRDARAYGIGQPTPLAHLLEQPRGHTA